LKKRNPILTKTIDTRDIKERIEDCFLVEEKDVYKTLAHKGFLWELSSLKNHYL
jgi:hypothetical protein